MATKIVTITEDEKMEDTKCSICMNIFQTPRILPCQHSFCHGCLCKVVKRFEGKPWFLCPLCRAVTKTDTAISTESTERLVTKFRVKVALQSQLEKRQVCRVCKTENNNETATVYCMVCDEHMCKVCGETHTKYKTMTNHQLRPSEEAPSSKVRKVLQELGRCPNHENENLEYICHDDDLPCCSKCALTTHRKCDNVMLIRDVIKNCKTYEASVKERKEMIDTNLKRVSALCNHLKEEPSRITSRHKHIQKQLIEIKTTINEELDGLFSAVEKAFTEEKSKILTSTAETLKDTTAKMIDIQNKKEDIEGVLSYGDDVQKNLYMRYQPSSVEADAAWQIEFTQKRIVLHIVSRCKDKKTPLGCLLDEIRSLIEVKQEICK